MKMSRTFSYAVKAVVSLAENGTREPIPCSRLAKEGQMPERFLLQILRSLVTKGILRSTRGVEGGYTLVRSPDEVSLLDVFEAIEGPMQAELPDERTLPLESQEAIRRALDDINEMTRRQLQSVKFAHLVPLPRETTKAD